MWKYLAIASLLAACTDQPIDTTSQPVAPDQPDQTDPPEPAPGPTINGVSWHWAGCGPTATAIPFGLIVTVDVSSPDDTYSLKGQAVGCDAFYGNGLVALCTNHPAAPVRMLTVAVGDVHGGDTRSIPLVDCTDGKWPPPPNQ